MFSRVKILLLLLVLLIIDAPLLTENKTVCGYELKGTVTAVSKAGGKIIFRVGIADRPERYLKGLQNCMTMAPDHGLLFILPSKKKYSFWMKDTYLPISVIYIDDSFRIVTIKKGTPLSTTSMRSPVPVKYVLEVLTHEAEKIDASKRVKIDL